MTDGEESVAAAEAAAREAFLASVALISRDVQQLDVPAQLLIEGVDSDLVCLTLANIVATLLKATLPEDGVRQVLVKVSRQIVGGEPR